MGKGSASRKRLPTPAGMTVRFCCQMDSDLGHLAMISLAVGVEESVEFFVVDHGISLLSTGDASFALLHRTDPFEGELQHIQQRLDGQDLRGIPVLVVESKLLLRYLES